MKRKEKALEASKKTLEVGLEYLVLSGVLLAILEGIRQLLSGLQSQEVSFAEFSAAVGYLILFGLIDLAILWVRNYKK